MIALRCLARILLVLSLAAIAGAAHADEKNKYPSAEDEKLLQGLLRDFVFDPQGAERVAANVRVRTVAAYAAQVYVQGWLVRRKEGDRLYFTDGMSMPAPEQQLRDKIDFVAECTKRYADGAKRDLDPNDPGDSDLIIAAWLFRLGENKLAATALARVGNRDGEIARVRKNLAWTAFAGMVHAFMVRAD